MSKGPPGWYIAAVRKTNPVARAYFKEWHRKYRTDPANRKRIVAHSKRFNKSARGRRLKRVWHLKRYGITLEEWTFVWLKQGKRCAICGTRRPKKVRGKRDGWQVDHDHATGKFRGILCLLCNLGLGYFKDNPKSLRKAVLYLKG
jgi:hypothetical protein